MVGSAIVRGWRAKAARSHGDVARRARPARSGATSGWIAREPSPDAVFLAAAKVGGILANDTYPADFLYDNLMIEANIIEARAQGRRRKAAVPRLVLHLSEICAAADTEDALLTGPLEPTNEWYAIAKIAGIKLAEAYRKQHGATSSRHADQPLRSRRQFRPQFQPCHAGADPQGA
jgi:GDP-L-fucose synthase